LIALQQSILAPQAYAADVSDGNTSGQLTVGYKLASRLNAYATYATGFKSVGLNLNGVPTDAANQPVLAAAAVKPEDTRNVEVGFKSEPFAGATANLSFYNTEIKNFQAQVTNGSVGVIRGYLANAEKVRVRGAEFDGSARVTRNFSLYGAVALTDGKYIRFVDAPPPLEATGGPQFQDISGSVLPGISRWATTFGAEYGRRLSLAGRTGQLFGALDTSYRSWFSSSATYSRYLVVDGYSLLNARVGFRAAAGWTVTLWSRNLLNKDYFELLTAAPGNTGLYVGQPGDPRTVGVTLRIGLGSR
jgi:iron complex outermembrane receptor protein